MKRDMDLVREILLDLNRREEYESLPSADSYQLREYSQAAVAYHLQIMREAGLVAFPDLHPGSVGRARRATLTWDGHEFVDQIRDPSKWSRVKAIVEERTGSVTYHGLNVMLRRLTQMALDTAASSFNAQERE